MTYTPPENLSPEDQALEADLVGRFVQWNVHSIRAKCQPIGWIVQANGCHIWTGFIDDNGYGVAKVGTRAVHAHRMRYEREIGPVPEGLVLDHFRCDNRACCNPAHVRPVTHRENIVRGHGMAPRHLARTHCAKGHELTVTNLVAYALRDGWRKCLACSRAKGRTTAGQQRARRAKKRLARNVL